MQEISLEIATLLRYHSSPNQNIKMETSKFINASYKLYDITDGKEELIEETTPEQPFTFISGLGLLLDAFEQQVVGLEAGAEFDFNLTPEQAYGPRIDEHTVELDRETFFVDGHFDDKNVYPDAIIPLQNEEGQRFNGRVTEITADKVIIDLNHPLAGRTLKFRGKIIESRDATNEELSQFVSQVTGQDEEGHGCGGGCGHHHHGDGECCGKHGHGDGECCGKHEHGDGECCGKHRHE